MINNDLDKKLFDKEYQTQLRREVEFLKNAGINYTFVKRINGINTYKYKKCKKLFQQLIIFYQDQ